MKQVLSLFICIILSQTMVFAEALLPSQPREIIYPVGAASEKHFAEEIILPEEEDTISLMSTTTAEEYITKSLRNGNTRLNLYSFRLSIQEGLNLFRKVALTHPEFFIYTQNFSYRYSGKYIYDITPVYLISEASKEDAQVLLEETISRLVLVGAAHSSDFDKILAVHNRIVTEYDYALRTDGSVNTDAIYTHPISFILHDEATCQGYTQLFNNVMARLGIETAYCYSDTLQHIWSMVKADDEWYHIDLTWDDPVVTDNCGNRVFMDRPYFSHFLRSDQSFSQNHGAKETWGYYISSPTATDTRYETGTIFSDWHYPMKLEKKNNIYHATISVSGADYTFPTEIRYLPLRISLPLISQNKLTTVMFCDENIPKNTLQIRTVVYHDSVFRGVQTYRNADISAGFNRCSFPLPSTLCDGADIGLLAWKNGTMQPYAHSTF